ncbi:hypothetical protein BDL97_03G124300 [Sphagnum fallax]|nr:hypothetical protein BDL97_03G124300 [Sphagnum fallax]
MASDGIYDSEAGVYRGPLRPALPEISDPYVDIFSFFCKNTRDPRYRNKLALVDGLTGEGLSFHDLKEKVRAVAAGLTKRFGIVQGDVVLILSPNTIWFPVVAYAVASLGAITTTANPAYTEREILKQVQDSKARLIVTIPSLLDRVRAFGLPVILFGDAEAVAQVVAKEEKSAAVRVSRFSDLLTFDPAEAPRVAVRQDSTAVLLYSSGTTGLSKGVVLTHRNCMYTAMQFQYGPDLELRQRVKLMLLPMFHVYGLVIVTFCQLQRGSTVVSLPKYELELALRTIEKYRVTDFPAVPPIVLALAKQKVVGNYDLSSLVELTSGAAPLGKDLMQEVARLFPSLRIRQGYGLTETSGLVSVATVKKDNSHFGSCGSLAPDMEAKVVDVATGKSLPPNEVGELWVRGPNIMQGYLEKPEETAATIDKEGWLHTGDVVYFDNEGSLYIVDRIKELIKCKGFQPP